ncbi:hypothetical protein [Rhodococcus sp. NPDC057529]|uniref:hypothetical protein n=1 Tax=Rhodococcus sp. NPDC057529 TaxID=3346158 RepID=UPI00366E57C8
MDNDVRITGPEYPAEQGPQDRETGGVLDICGIGTEEGDRAITRRNLVQAASLPHASRRATAFIECDEHHSRSRAGGSQKEMTFA